MRGHREQTHIRIDARLQRRIDRQHLAERVHDRRAGAPAHGRVGPCARVRHIDAVTRRHDLLERAQQRNVVAARAHDAAQALPAVDDYLLIGSVRDRAGEPDAAQQRPNGRRHRRYPNIRPRPAPPVVAHAPRMDREFYFFCCHVLFTLLEPLHLPEQTEQRQADPSLCSGNANNCPKRSSTEWRSEFESKYARKQYRPVRIATAQWVITAKYTAPLSKKIPLENHPFSASMDDTGTGARMSPSRHKPRPAWRCGSRHVCLDVSARIAEWLPAEICQIQTCAMAPFASEPPIGCRAPRQTAHGGEKRNKKSSKKATQASRSCVKVHRSAPSPANADAKPKVTNHHKHEPKSARDENMRSLLHESFHAA